MKITRRQLRRIIKEAVAATSSGFEDWSDGDFVDAIRDYSKELTGRRDTYGDYEDLEALTMIELQDYYQEMFDSPEAQAYRDQRDREEQKFADSELGYDEELHPLEKSPLRQGMGHRQESIRRREKRIIENREDRLTLNLKLSPSGNDVELEVGESGETYNLGAYTDASKQKGGLYGLMRQFEVDHGMEIPPGTMVYDVDGVDIGDLPIEQMFQAVADMYAGF